MPLSAPLQNKEFNETWDITIQRGLAMKQLNIQILLTGNELMLGDIVDSNSAMIAQQLKNIGLNIQRKVTVADDLTYLVDEIKQMSIQADILIINGGLGPTIDDLTAQALAQASGVELSENSDALKHLSNWCEQRGQPLAYPNLKQVHLPTNTNIIANPIGSAVGFTTQLNGCDIYCTPGVPHELEQMMITQILPMIKKGATDCQQYQVIRSQVFGYGESSVQNLLDTSFSNWPDEIELGFRAAMPFLEIKIACQSSDNLPLLKNTQTKIESLLGDHIISIVDKKNKTMAEHVLGLLNDKNLKITMAESCTGGLISSLFTNISGSSQAFEAGFVTYSNEIKRTLLDVKTQTIEQHGAVSKEVVIEMAQGALKKSQANIAIAVSGIAGPSGGSVDKPVGSVWLAWGSKEKIETQYFCIKGNRKYFQTMVANRGLDLVRRMLINSSEIPNYMK